MIANLYVHNVASGCPSKFEAISYYNEAHSMMSGAQFRSWASNSPRLMDQANRDNVADANNPVNV